MVSGRYIGGYDGYVVLMVRTISQLSLITDKLGGWLVLNWLVSGLLHFEA